MRMTTARERRMNKRNRPTRSRLAQEQSLYKLLGQEGSHEQVASNKHAEGHTSQPHSVLRPGAQIQCQTVTGERRDGEQSEPLLPQGPKTRRWEDPKHVVSVEPRAERPSFEEVK